MQICEKKGMDVWNKELVNLEKFINIAEKRETVRIAAENVGAFLTKKNIQRGEGHNSIRIALAN